MSFRFNMIAAGLAAAVALVSVLLLATPSGACAGPCPGSSAHAGGTRFVDRNANGVRDAGEPGQYGVTIYLDADDDGKLGAGEPRTTTGPEGDWSLTFDPNGVGIPAGEKRSIRTIEKGGFACSAPSPCEHRFAWKDGDDVRGLQFGGQAQAIVTGTVYDDRDASGDRKNAIDEPGLPGKVVWFDDNMNGTRDAGEPSATTDESGEYSISVDVNADHSAARVKLEREHGVGCTAPKQCAWSLGLTSPGTTTGVDFAEYDAAVVFLHGFLGSVVNCGGEELWPRIPKQSRLADMRLAEDGIHNLSRADGGNACTESAAPTGALVEKVLTDEIYGPAVRGFQAMVSDPSRARFLAWDWRKGPDQAVAQLDALIDSMRRELHVDKVVIAAHSYGGLLMRTYLEDPEHAKKVVRAVSIGTPYWGSPKAIFPLATGYESPMWSGMDMFLPDDELKRFAQNMQGVYYLFPTPEYGPWLRVEGRGSAALTAAQQKAFVFELDGNASLWQRAQDLHASVLNHFHTAGVDYQVVIGEGVPTITSVKFAFGADPADSKVELGFGNGDKTVPAVSAAHDTPAARLHRVCGIDHVTLPGAPVVLDGLRDWVLDGEQIELPGGCEAGGDAIGVYGVNLARASSARVRARGATQAGMSLDDASRAGLVDVVRAGRQTIVVTDDARPVTLDLGSGRHAVTVTRLDGGSAGPVTSYGVLSGGSVVAGSGAGAVVKSASGAPVAPRAADRTPPVTKAKLERSKNGKAYTLTAKATDAGGQVVATRVRVGGRSAAPKALPAKGLRLTKAQLAKGVFVYSVDAVGNTERERRVKP